LRTKIDWRSASRENYTDFCRRHPNVQLTFDQWKSIIYDFNESFKEHILETGDRIKFPFGFGEFSINKRKRKRYKTKDNHAYINLPVDWKKTREKGKIIYNFNFHTEGYFFGWKWFKTTARLKNIDLWYFKPSRSTSRLLAHYLNVNDKYQHIYREWKV
jgi:nucleoid DNA-binding protein